MPTASPFRTSRAGSQTMIAAPERLHQDAGARSAILGHSPAICRAIVLAKRFASTDLPILLKGQTARARSSSRRPSRSGAGARVSLST
jgi:transcriptional regulator with PAS, ATPase and Fis domain